MKNSIITALINKGVNIISPESVYIADDVCPDRIAPGTVIYPGCRISGEKTFVSNGSKLGSEGPATIENCALGKNVELKGGYYSRSVFFEKSCMGPDAHVREGCILEEEANAAHTVGLKQTILFPFVTLGSLINFCDCLMAGGTDRKNHSEVGSSYIHFNFTPNQDKATPSLIGNVEKGVFLRERPIFLGGQGGLIGPSKIGFGAVISAGTVFKGELDDCMIYSGSDNTKSTAAFTEGLYACISRKVKINISYIANLIALKAWYKNIRSMFLDEHLIKAGIETINSGIDERISRLNAFALKIPVSIEALQSSSVPDKERLAFNQSRFLDKWPQIRHSLESMRDHQGDEKLKSDFMSAISQGSESYIRTIKTLDENTVNKGVKWLSSICSVFPEPDYLS